MLTPPTSALHDVGLHEQITAIDAIDNYPIDKLQAHVQNVRHVAISIFVFRNNQLLLQQRAATKYHSAKLWANTVCSHPRWNEAPQDCADRRLYEELGFNTPLRPFGHIDYQAQVGELYENEHVHCFFGTVSTGQSITNYNPKEVANTEWLSLDAINQQILQRPHTFSAWFKIYMREYRHMIDDQLT